MSKPSKKIIESKYQCIRAWGRALGSYSYYIADQQALAEADNAPLDAIYKRDDGWHRLSQVTSVTTIAWFRLNEPELYAQYLKPKEEHK